MINKYIKVEQEEINNNNILVLIPYLNFIDNNIKV